MKLLIVISSLDLTQPYSATPGFWQLMKALYEIGVEVVVTPYQGPAIESLWWRAERNPAKLYGDVFKRARDTLRAIAPAKNIRDAQTTDTNSSDQPTTESLSDQLTRKLAQTLVAPLWHRHLSRILTEQPDIDAVIFLTVPLNHLKGVPADLQARFNKPVFYFDGDVPASLPNMKGFASGFRIYQGADLSEYTAFISNSLGGEAYLQQLGAQATHTVWYGADPSLYAPISVTQDYDAFFFGHGREYRSEWIDAMLVQPAQALPDARFAVRGKNLGDLGRVEQLPYLSFSKLREYVCRSKLNLVITRGAHASVYGSSSSRPFELAAMQAAMIANPYAGIELWFEPEQEIIIVNSAEEAIERYRYLLAHDTARQQLAQSAYKRFLKQHTFQHRAHDLKAIIAQYL